MAYFLRQDKRKNGIYLQMYENYWDKDLKQARSKWVKSFGYVKDLTSDEIPDLRKYHIHQQEEGKHDLQSWI